MSNEMGTLRPSQLIYNFGPGSIVDMVNQSVVVMAADLWNTRYTPKEIDERISKALKIDHIKLLNERPDSVKVKANPFPKWKICPNCNMMTDFNNLHCYHCKQQGKEIELYPSRFVVACDNGHLSDFPYVEWVHQNKKCTSDNSVLKFIRQGDSGSLSDLYVQCVKCKEKQSLGKIMQKGALKSILPFCTGERPWIGDTEKCESDENITMETYLRGASNIYSPAVTSFLQIPLSEENKDSVMGAVLGNKTALLNAREMGEEMFQMQMKILRLHDSDKEKVEQILDGVYEEEVSYQSIRKQEWNTLIKGNEDDSSSGYSSRNLEIHENMKPYFSSIHKIESLPEIQVLQGFTRIDYLDRFEVTKTKDLIPVMKDTKAKWLPGIRNNGEGIFFRFDESKLKDWDRNTEHESITSDIINRYNRQRDQLGYNPLSIESKHLLIHTFSHALIKELAAHSGYSTTSLKERLFCGSDMQGVLIYTASGDSEGSLGGLIELASPEKLYPIFIRAIEGMMYCSSDPNCSEGEFKYQSTANGAACHSCSYVSETSCEWGNQLLDRRLLLNINPGETKGFFDQL
ncbi:MAG: DrmB family protein [Bacillota bacterium]